MQYKEEHMNDIYKNNIQNSIISAQKSIYSSALLATIIYTLTASEQLDKLKIPLVSLETNIETGILIIMLLYIALGANIFYSLYTANKNLKEIKDPELKKALLLAPSIVCGPLLIRLSSVLLPFIILFSCFYTIFKSNIIVALLMSIVYSGFHIYALSESFKLKNA